MKCAICIMVGDTMRDALTIINGTAACRDHVSELGAWENSTAGPLSYRSYIRSAYPETNP